MALTLIKEDGTGKADANSYADVTGADGYFEGHMYAGLWSGAAADEKAVVLVMATRLIDSLYQFNGFRAHSEQALQWPREGCPDPDRGSGESVPADLVPAGVVQAACEMGRELLIVDRTAPPTGEGIDSIQTAHASKDANGSSSESSTTKYSKSDTPPIIPRYIQSMLAKYGRLLTARSSQVRLVRV